MKQDNIHMRKVLFIFLFLVSSLWSLVSQKVLAKPSVISISGTVYSNEGITPVTSTIKLVIDGTTTYTTNTNANGVYTINQITQPATSSVVTLWMNNGSDKNRMGAVVTRYVGSGDIAKMDIYSQRLIVRHEDKGPVINSDLAVCDQDTGSACAASNLHFNILGTDLTVDNDWSLYVWADKTFSPGGTVTLSNGAEAAAVGGDLKLDTNATLNLENNLFIGGDWINNKQGILIFSKGSSTITFTATSTGFQINNGEKQHFNNLIFNGVEGKWTMNSDLVVDGNFTIQNGDVVSGKILNIGGDFYNSNIFNHNFGTVNFNGQSQTIYGSNTFYNLTKVAFVSSSLIFASSTSQTILGDLTLWGLEGSMLYLRSNELGSSWNINLLGERNLLLLDVQDSNNISKSTIICDHSCIDRGRNISWLFKGSGGGDNQGVEESNKAGSAKTEAIYYGDGREFSEIEFVVDDEAKEGVTKQSSDSGAE